MQMKMGESLLFTALTFGVSVGFVPYEDMLAFNAPASDQGKVYQNEAFRNVTVEKTAFGHYVISGEARVFEATVNYVVTSGQSHVTSGYTTASKGGPDWGTFQIELDTTMLTAYSQPLAITLFEASAEDGRPLHELTIPLF
ncbi:Gmad2 immunoglobulin-like domain-containing protein [Brevibacillus fluminis]|uniref:Gmad2 immunoglobulin-like domain-containing protein n=1 Tax=Brevibacillus fluminis TaxID=511487 RepID=UPI003F8BC816